MFRLRRIPGLQLSLNFQGGAKGEPFRGAERGHVREVRHIPEHDILFLHALIVFVIPELTTSPEYPWDILGWIGATNRDIEVSKAVPFSVVF